MCCLRDRYKAEHSANHTCCRCLSPSGLCVRSLSRLGWTVSRNQSSQHISLQSGPPHRNIIRFHIYSTNPPHIISSAASKQLFTDPEPITQPVLAKVILLCDHTHNTHNTHTLRYEPNVLGLTGEAVRREADKEVD